MPHKLTWETSGVCWKYYGNVSGKELIEASTVVYGDPRFDGLKYKLVDFSDIESIDLDDKEILLIAKQHQVAEQYNPHIKNAIIIKSKTSRLANKFAELFRESKWDIQVFQDLEEANDWLNRKYSTK